MGAALRIKQLRQAQADTSNRLKAITDLIGTENRAMTAAEHAEFGTLEASFDAQAKELEMVQRQAERERAMAGIAPDANQGAAAAAAAAVTGAGEQFESFGQMLLAVRAAAMPNGARDPRLLASASGLNETVGSDGGFLVGSDRATTILERTYAVGQFLAKIPKIPISATSNGTVLPAVDETSRANGSRFGGIVSYWLGEAGQKPFSMPKFRLMKLKLNKVIALVPATDELLEDAPALEAWIDRQLPLELAFRVEDAVFNGTGASMPLGFMNSSGTIVVPKEAGQTAVNPLVFQNIVNMWARFYGPSRQNSIWLTDQSVEAALPLMSLPVGAGGVPVFMPAGGAANQPFSTLFGRPIIPTEYGAPLGTQGDIALIDPTQYVLIDKNGVQKAVSIHVRFQYDEQLFRFVYRVDGQPEWNAPLQPKSGSATLSPFVVLQSRP
jgi:HK97 family phage major capsid protein